MRARIAPARREAPINMIDLTDTRFKYRRNFREETIRGIRDSVEKTGLLNPVKLWKQEDHITIIAGWQRTTATILLGAPSILADVYEGITYEEALRISIADNHLRKNLSDYETSLQMTALNQRDHYTPEKLAELYGCGVARVYDLLSVSSMSPELKEALEKGSLSLYQSVVINRFPVSERSEILDKTLREGRSVKWLKAELTDLKRHPLIRNPLADIPLYRRHALRVPLSEEYFERRRAYWNLLGKPAGLPSPMSCEFTTSIMAQNFNPPYICRHDAEWAILAYGKFPRGEDHSFDWDKVPLDKRDNWGFYCERCARLTFPDILFHRDTYYRLPNWKPTMRIMS